MKHDGSQSWIVIGRVWTNTSTSFLKRMGNLFITENWLQVRWEPSRRNTRNNQLHNSTITFILSTMVVPIGQRKWKDILAVDHVDKGSLSFSVSKTMTRILQHRGLHRDRWSNGFFFCCVCFVAIAGASWDGRIVRGCTICIQDATRKYFSDAWTLTAPSTTCVPSKITLEDIKLIHYRWITWKFRTCGVSTFVGLVLLSVGILFIHSGLIAGGQDTKRMKTNSILHSRWSYDRFSRRRIPRKVEYKTNWEVLQDAENWINLKRAQDKGFSILAKAIQFHYLLRLCTIRLCF